MTPKILVICGPTASGKSVLAQRLACELDGEIVNADSMQVYRGMDIGTAKPSPRDRASAAHHLIDICDPDHNLSAAGFAAAADAAIADITARGRRVIVAGGTGLYIRALLQGLVDSPSGADSIRSELQREAREKGNQAMLEELRTVDPESAARMHPNNMVRIIRALEVHRLTGVPLSRHQNEHGFGQERYRAFKIAPRVARNELYHRIEERVDQMIAAGLVEEVSRLLAAGYHRNLKAMRAIGYKEIASFLAGECNREQAVSLIKRDTRRYAKRQLTWFNGERDILWVEYPEKFASILKHAHEFFDDREA